MNYIIKNGDMSFTISTLGAELISAKNASGDEFIWQANPDFWSDHAPLLFPVCGRLKGFYYMYKGKRYDMGIHGFLRHLEFKVVSSSDTQITLSVSENEETLKQYPFKFTVTVTYKAENCTLLSTYTVKNDSEELMPFAFGLHPGFNVFTEGGITVNDYRVIFDKSAALRRTPLSEYPNGPEFLPTEFENGALKIDNDAIAAIDTIVLKNVGTHTRLVCDKSNHEIEMSFSENLPLYCIWKNPSMEAQYLCLEPWTTEPARYVDEEDLSTRKNMIPLASGKSESFFCNFTFKK